MNIIDNDLLSIQESRILAENAKAAQKYMSLFSQEQLDSIVDNMVAAVSGHTKELAKMSYGETDYGNWEDKYIKNNIVCGCVWDRIRSMRCVGVIAEDKQKFTMDIGVPVGVIAALCPDTSPVSTTIYNVLIALKSGNAIVFSPHPRAKNSICAVLDIMIKAAEESGLPQGAVSYLSTVTASGTRELMKHPDISLVLISGVPGMLETAYESGKPLIYGGYGNGPVFIERTADITQAVSDILSSKTFDNGIVSAAEQSVVVDGAIEKQVREEMLRQNAYFMTSVEAEKLSRIIYYSDGKANPEAIGKSAVRLAHMVGILVPESTEILISEQKYVSTENPYSREKLCPVLAFYVEDNWMGACEKCMQLLLSERKGHTLVIHSRDEKVIREFALKKPVARMLVNTPATFGGMGITTNLFPSMVLGSGSAGRGMTSDNVSPMNLVYIRKVGYGVRSVDEALDIVGKKVRPVQPTKTISVPIETFPSNGPVEILTESSTITADNLRDMLRNLRKSLP